MKNESRYINIIISKMYKFFLILCKGEGPLKKKRVLSYFLSIFILLNLLPNIKISAEEGKRMDFSEENFTVTGTTYHSTFSRDNADFGNTDFIVKGATADKLPPELISVSIDKTTVTPYEVATITIEAVDDFSGIRYIRARYLTPDGSWHDVYLNHVDNNIYKGYVNVYLYDTIGTYKLSDIYMVDRMGRWVEYRAGDKSHGKDLSKCNFQVAGTIVDTYVPVFNGITVNKNSGTIGDTLIFTIDCEDTQSGIASTNELSYYASSITFVSDTGKIVESPIKYENGRYVTIFNVGKYTDAGSWKVYAIYLLDNAGYSYWVGNKDVNYNDYQHYGKYYFDEKIDLKAVGFTVHGTYLDEQAPVLDSIILNKTDINFNQISTITVKATDDLSGIRTEVYEDNYYGTSTMIFLDPSGYIKPYSLKKGEDGYYVDFYVNIANNLGTWQPAALVLVDNAGNSTSYVQPDLSQWTYYDLMNYIMDESYVIDYDFSSYSINVNNPKADIVPPVLNKATIDKTIVNGKDQATITLDITDDCFISNGYWLGYIGYRNGDDWEYYSVVKENDKYISKISFEGLEKNGLWEVEFILISDESGNQVYYYNSTDESDTDNYKVMDLSHLNITATGMKDDSEETDNNRATISNISVSKNNINIINNTPVELSIEFPDSSSQIDYFYDAFIVYVSPSGTNYKKEYLEFKEGKLMATLDFSTLDELGTWRIDTICLVSDNQRINLVNSTNPYKYIGENDTIMDLTNLNIELNGPIKDSSKPVFKSVAVEKTSIDLGEATLITVNAEDESGIASVKVRYTTAGGVEAAYALEKFDKGFQGYISPFGWKTIIGQWRLLSIEIVDNTGNTTIIGNLMNDKLDLTTVDMLTDLSSGDFEVTDNLLTDVTGDGQIDIMDLALAARSYNLDQNSPCWEARADVNKDKKVDIYDLVLICGRQ